jgi:lipoate-protein ligase A
VESPTFDPRINLERETDYMKTLKTPSFRVWRNTDSVVLGRFLQTEDEVHLNLARELGVPVLHRPSGGGAVFHDLGNINYSIYLPRGHLPDFDIEKSLIALSFPVTNLLDSLGVPWSWEPPNNVYVLGGKISGAAQARSGGHLLHHGTLLVSSDLRKMGQLLKPGGRSRIAPVVNLSEIVRNITVEEVERLLHTTISVEREGLSLISV